MLILAVYRKLVMFHQNVTRGRWHQGIPRTVDIYELEGRTVGLVGDVVSLHVPPQPEHPPND